MWQRHWKGDPWNTICLAWLTVGYCLAAAFSCIKRKSLEPWRFMKDGARKGIALALPDAGKD
jgi:hypothetical protein